MDEREKTEEAALIDAARRGDHEAFERLVSSYHKRAYGYALRQTGDPDTAEDVCQEALLKAFRSIASYDDRWAFSTWLFRIIRNTYFDHLRKRDSRVAEESFSDGEEPAEATDAALHRFSEQMQARDREEWILAAIQRLPPGLRSLVVLRDLQGLSYDEIVQITGMPLGTVKSRLNRARQLLRADLSS